MGSSVGPGRGRLRESHTAGDRAAAPGDAGSSGTAGGAQAPHAAQTPHAPQAPQAPQAPVVPQSPVVAKPAASAQAAHGKQKAPEATGQKGKFRETMWFKKGDLDTQAAISAAEERARTGKDAADKADSLPMDERYKDDGSISRGDKEKYSLRTGGTQMMAAMRNDPAASMSGKVSEDALIGEMKGGRGKVLIAIAIAVVAIVLLIVLVAT